MVRSSRFAKLRHVTSATFLADFRRPGNSNEHRKKTHSVYGHLAGFLHRVVLNTRPECLNFNVRSTGLQSGKYIVLDRLLSLINNQ